MCNKESLNIEAVQQTLLIISGKWKIPIIVALRLYGKSRFKDLMEHIEGIGSKMLSKELKDLEENGIINRHVYSTTPVSIDYELSLYGKTLDNIIEEMCAWGTIHKQKLENYNPNHAIEHFNTIDI